MHSSMCRLRLIDQPLAVDRLTGSWLAAVGGRVVDLEEKLINFVVLRRILRRDDDLLEALFVDVDVWQHLVPGLKR